MNNPVRTFDAVEEGEIECVGGGYDPAFECPSGNEVSQYPAQRRISSPSPPPASVTNQTTVFRLIRISSPVISRSKRVAVLDGHAEVSVGRDVAPSARVRLKEMAVSKFHASIYWDGLQRKWGIVDMGSVHGTFVRSAQDPSTSTLRDERTLGTRLSEARHSSMPRVLRHLDKITIGRTTFLVHEHVTGRPCPECAIDGPEEITLFPSHARAPEHPPSEEEQSLKRKRGDSADERDPKKAMAKLKSSLMSRHTTASTSPTPNAEYKDRSALRRVLHPEPRVASIPSSLQLHADQNPTPDCRLASPPPPPAALPSSNIGHKLLLLQGWNPGTALGDNPDEGLVEPIRLSANMGRAGLGSSVHQPVSQQPGDWREAAKQRRWDDVRDR